MLCMNKNDCMVVDVAGIAIERNSNKIIKPNNSLCDDTKTKQISKEIFVGCFWLYLCFKFYSTI